MVIPGFESPANSSTCDQYPKTGRNPQLSVGSPDRGKVSESYNFSGMPEPYSPRPVQLHTHKGLLENKDSTVHQMRQTADTSNNGGFLFRKSPQSAGGSDQCEYNIQD